MSGIESSTSQTASMKVGAPRGASITRRLATWLPRIRGRDRALLALSRALNPRTERFAEYAISQTSSVLLDLADPNYWMLYFLGLYEPDVTRAITTYLQPGGVFVDCGANIGYFSSLAADIVGKDGEVIAFEPLPEVAAIAKANLERNRFAHSRLINAAVSDKSGSAQLFREHGAPHGHTSLSQTALVSADAVPCILVRLDDVIPREIWSRVSVIKLDIEGAELPALRGATELLSQATAKLIVEINPESARRTGYEVSAIFEYLGEKGYDALHYAGGEWRRVDNWPDDQSGNLVFSRRTVAHG